MGVEKLLISTDVIESLNGQLKIVEGRKALISFGGTVFTLALRCGKHTGEELLEYSKSVSDPEMKEFVKTNLPQTLHSERIAKKKTLNALCQSNKTGGQKNTERKAA